MAILLGPVLQKANFYEQHYTVVSTPSNDFTHTDSHIQIRSTAYLSNLWHNIMIAWALKDMAWPVKLSHWATYDLWALETDCEV